MNSCSVWFEQKFYWLSAFVDPLSPILIHDDFYTLSRAKPGIAIQTV